MAARHLQALSGKIFNLQTYTGIEILELGEHADAEIGLCIFFGYDNNPLFDKECFVLVSDNDIESVEECKDQLIAALQRNDLNIILPEHYTQESNKDQ